MNKLNDNLLWKEQHAKRNEPLLSNESVMDNDIEQSIDWIMRDTFIDKLRRLFNSRRKSDVKVVNYNNLTDEERLSIHSDDFIDDDFDDYNCGCKCDLKECDTACCTYFALQDYKPYRKVDMNIPELKHLSQEEKQTSYNHFQKILKVRNCKPYYFLKYLFSKMWFEIYKQKNK